MGEPPGDPDEVQETGARLLDPPNEIEGGTDTAPPADGWTYEGVTSFSSSHDPLQIHRVETVQKQEVSGGGDYLHRRMTLREENRVVPAEGGRPDHRELETDNRFDAVGVVTSYLDGPLTETAGVVMAEIGFQADDPLWYWTPIEHEAEPATGEKQEDTGSEPA